MMGGLGLAVTVWAAEGSKQSTTTTRENGSAFGIRTRSSFEPAWQPPNVGISCGRVRRPGGPARRVPRRRRDGSGRQLYAELG